MNERRPCNHGISAMLFIMISTGIVLIMDVSGKVLAHDVLWAPVVDLTCEDESRKFPCTDYLFKVSEDGIRYVREAGAGTLFVASLEGKIGFFVMQYGFMVPAGESEIDPVNARKLVRAYSECQSTYTPAGTHFMMEDFIRRMSKTRQAD